jgi:hypothetical protein
MGRIYQSPNTSDTAPLKDQFETIERQMTPVQPAAFGKHDTSLMLGDFNAKIGLQEPTPVVGLPKRKGYTTTCLAGRSLLQAMTNQGWTVASNQLCLDVHPTWFMATFTHISSSPSLITSCANQPTGLWSKMKELTSAWGQR